MISHDDMGERAIQTTGPHSWFCRNYRCVGNTLAQSLGLLALDLVALVAEYGQLYFFPIYDNGNPLCCFVPNLQRARQDSLVLLK